MDLTLPMILIVVGFVFHILKILEKRSREFNERCEREEAERKYRWNMEEWEKQRQFWHTVNGNEALDNTPYNEFVFGLQEWLKTFNPPATTPSDRWHQDQAESLSHVVHQARAERNYLDCSQPIRFPFLDQYTGLKIYKKEVGYDNYGRKVDPGLEIDSGFIASLRRYVQEGIESVMPKKPKPPPSILLRPVGNTPSDPDTLLHPTDDPDKEV